MVAQESIPRIFRIKALISVEKEWLLITSNEHLPTLEFGLNPVIVLLLSEAMKLKVPTLLCSNQHQWGITEHPSLHDWSHNQTCVCSSVVEPASHLLSVDQWNWIRWLQRYNQCNWTRMIEAGHTTVNSHHHSFSCLVYNGQWPRSSIYILYIVL